MRYVEVDHPNGGPSSLLWQGHVLGVLRSWGSEVFHCCVTSPPYWGLRDYKLEPQVWGGDAECSHDWRTKVVTGEMRYGLGLRDSPASTRGGAIKVAKTPNIEAKTATCTHCNAWRGSLGLEPTPELYVGHLVAIFREVRRVLRKDGTCWLNVGDSYASGGGNSKQWRGPTRSSTLEGGKSTQARSNRDGCPIPLGLKPKDLVMIPFRVALALQADGWWVRSDIIWAKSNPMPESVRDRPTRSHEYVFLLTKSARYHFDADAVKEDAVKGASGSRFDQGKTAVNMQGVQKGYRTTEKRNIRSVWTIATKPYPEAHFATFPPTLVEPCIKAGCPPDGLVLDPFMGTGTTLQVARDLGREAWGVELSPESIELAKRRLRS